MFEKEAEDFADSKNSFWRQGRTCIDSVRQAYQKDAEFGYNKAKEEIHKQNYSLFDFVMQYENGKFKCKYKSGKEFVSIDGKTWKEIALPKESE